MLLTSWKWIFVPMLLAIATPAIGGGVERFSIYGWRDNTGVEHYTNELADVPEEYRNQVATLVKDWSPPEPASEEAKTKDKPETIQASPTPLQASPDVPKANVTDHVDASQNLSVVQDTQVVTQQPVLYDYDLLPAGGRLSSAPGERPPRDVFAPVGPIPQHPAGPPPLAAAGPPPLGAAGHSPTGFAGRRQ